MSTSLNFISKHKFSLFYNIYSKKTRTKKSQVDPTYYIFIQLKLKKLKNCPCRSRRPTGEFRIGFRTTRAGQYEILKNVKEDINNRQNCGDAMSCISSIIPAILFLENFIVKLLVCSCSHEKFLYVTGILCQRCCVVL